MMSVFPVDTGVACSLSRLFLLQGYFYTMVAESIVLCDAKFMAICCQYFLLTQAWLVVCYDYFFSRLFLSKTGYLLA